MRLLRGIVALCLALGCQAALARIWPGAHQWVDFLLVPVAVYATSRSQRATLLVGCASGLLHDAWFGVGAFGATGLRRTLLAWAVGGLASRLDMGHVQGRLAAGAVLGLGDALLEPVVLRLLDLRPGLRPIGPILVQALVTALLAALAGAVADSLPSTRKGSQKR